MEDYIYNRNDALRESEPVDLPSFHVPHEWSFGNDAGVADIAGKFGESFIEEFAPAQAMKILAGTDIYTNVRDAGDELAPVEGYDPINEASINKVPLAFRGDLLSSKSPIEYGQKFQVIQEYQAAQADRLNHPSGYAGLIAGGLVSPGGLLGLAARTGKGVAAAAAATTIDEVILNQTDPNRNSAISALTVGTSTVFDTGFITAKTFFKNRKYALDPIEEEAISRHVAQVKTLDEGFNDVEGTLRDIYKGMDDAEAAGDTARFAELEAEGMKVMELLPPIKGGSQMARKAYSEGRDMRYDLVNAFLLEKLPDSPVKRILATGDNDARQIITQLVESPFFLEGHMAVTLKSPIGVDRKIGINWIKPMKDAMQATDEAYIAYRKSIAEGSSISGSPSLQTIRDVATGGRKEGTMSFNEFLEEVTRAKRSLDGPANPNINEHAINAARIWNDRVYKRAGSEAQRLGLFTIGAKREVRSLQKQIKEAGDGADVAKLQKKLVAAEESLKELESIKIKQSYVNRIYNNHAIRNDMQGFKDILMAHERSAKEADAIIDTLLNRRIQNADEAPVSELAQDIVGRARSMKDRSLGDIPDEILEPFLENNMMALGRYYTTRMGADIELASRFGGEIDMFSQLRKIEGNYNARIAKAEKSGKDTAKLIKQRDDTLEDIRVVRDRIRGTYGLPDDPESWTNRGIRVAKMHTAMTSLTGAIAAIPDVANIVFYDGMMRGFGRSFESLSNGLENIKLARADAELAGEALDWYMSTRAALFSDLSDAMSTTTPFENAMAKGTQMFFNANLMNPWNVGAKSMASVMAGSMIIEESIKLGAGGAKKSNIQRLARAGIGKSEARVIAEQFEKHGTRGDKIRIANVAKWDESAKEVAEIYKAALGREINTIVVTPGKGELPNFMGGGFERVGSKAQIRKAKRKAKKQSGEELSFAEKTEDLFMSPQMAQLLFQFKLFGISSGARVLVPGLQQADKRFLQQAAGLVALGMMVDHVRSSQTGQWDNSLSGKLKRGIDRSGITGWGADAGNAIMSAADGRVASNVPFVHKATQLGSVVSNLAQGEFGRRDIHNLRANALGQANSYTDVLFDLMETGAKNAIR